MTTAVLFPGQGSQELGMGEALFNKYPEYIERANKIIGFDVSHLCLSGEIGGLDRTDNAQIAIYIVNALNYLQWQEKNESPDYVLGHSIGQYNAMLAAKMMSFEEGLALVQLRGKLMAQQHHGAMAAVMKLSSDDLTESLANEPLLACIDIANYNSEYQTVISGNQEDIERSIPVLQDAGAFVVLLKTSGAFHSRYMTQAKNEYLKHLTTVSFSEPTIRLICNTTAAPITDPVTALSQHLVSPVDWFRSIYCILEKDSNTIFYESGHGKTLTNILRYNKKEYSESLAIA